MAIKDTAFIVHVSCAANLFRKLMTTRTHLKCKMDKLCDDILFYCNSLCCLDIRKRK